MNSPLSNTLFRLLLIDLAGMVFVWGWVIHHLIRRRPIQLPSFRDRRTSPPWGLGTMVLVLLVYLGVNVGVIHVYLRMMGHEPVARVKARLDTPEVLGRSETTEAKPAEAKPAETPQPEPTTPVVDHPVAADSNESPLSVIEGMFLLTLINEILIVAIPALVWLTSRTRLIDLGITTTQWLHQIIIGAGAALFIAPIVYTIQFCAVLIWSPNDHPIQDMIRDQFTPPVAYLAVLSAVVMAPIIEELLFRGLVQNWLFHLASRKIVRIPAPIDGPTADNSPGLNPSNPSAADDDILIPISPGRAATQAIVTTSLFFAIVHSAQWPAPIPIFLLSMALGIVYHQTGSLLASIAMHATFNSTSTLMLFLAMSGNPETPAVKIPLPEPGLRSAPIEVGQTERAWIPTHD